jgi:hypothetical protein
MDRLGWDGGGMMSSSKTLVIMKDRSGTGSLHPWWLPNLLSLIVSKILEKEGKDDRIASENDVTSWGQIPRDPASLV